MSPPETTTSSQRNTMTDKILNFEQEKEIALLKIKIKEQRKDIERLMDWVWELQADKEALTTEIRWIREGKL